MLKHILTDQSLTVINKGRAHVMTSDHPSFNDAIDADKVGNEDEVNRLFDIGASIEDFAEGNVEVKDGIVRYMGKPIHNVVVDKILGFMREGAPFEPMIRFLSKLMENPSHRAVNELYTFLEHKNMPITPDGNFLAYKGVREDYTDHHTGTFDNSIGESHNMPRNQVCDNKDIGCSGGFHAGSYEYASSFGSGHTMLVEINPRDVVSIPSDCRYQKLRTCKYSVVAVATKVEDKEYTEAYATDELGNAVLPVTEEFVGWEKAVNAPQVAVMNN